MELDKRLIGIRIMQRRKSRGMTQEELSEKIGVSKNHISSIERGLNVPTTQFLFNLCNVLGESPDYYLIGKLSDGGDELTNLIRQLPHDTQKTLCVLIQAYLNCI